ncbi:MAG: hypothetical protein IPM54_37015 [Polyangiaceae bacterium]|nr:hypothetical protein [Polyangiaceae bacterium]
MSRRCLAGSMTFVSLALSVALFDGTAIAWAQPAAPPSSAPIAPKGAPPAPPASAAAASPTPVPTEVPAEPPPPPAQEAPPAQPPAEPAADLAQWQKAYERGKAALASGSFPLASQILNDVAMRAPDPGLRAQARELSHLASYWAYNRLTLMPAQNTLPPRVDSTEPREDKRTIDELAILYGNSILWGTGFGVVVGFASDSGDASTFFLPAIGMSALGAGALALMDVKFGPLPYGVPQSITSGMYMGLEAGIYMAAILEAERIVDRDEEKILPGLIWGSATAGGLIGGLIGATVPVTPGRASFTSSGAIWGGVVTSFVTIGFMDGDFNSAPFVTGLIGAAAGGVSTGLLAARVSPSIARVRFIDLGGVAGGLLFGGLYASIADRMDEQVFSFLASSGVVAGLATAAWLTSGMDRDEPRRGALRKSEFHMTPFMTPQPGGGTMGLAGRF